ncbi:hypothetical protein F0562_005851 [Nyssa sinensis]|uniref:J domain-containing protein n=1 Tax=Nyssa sinensis TaxID=561372 RepID=A0A5J5AMZ9_9ASTE|nr:hypothetical protein F0562_005851 [Nyssa sinensis]
MASAMYLAVNAPEGRGGGSQVHYDSVFNGSSDSAAKFSSLPVLDEPIYEGVPGLTNSSSVTYDDVFSTMALPRKQVDAFDNLLGGLAKNMKETELKGLGRTGSGGVEKAVSGFDDLIPGFGSTSPCDRKTSKPIADAAKTISTRMEQIGEPSNSGSTKVDGSSVNGVVFNSIDPLFGLGKSVPMFSSETNKKGRDRSPLQTGPSLSRTKTSNEEPVDKSPVGTPKSLSQNIPADDQESHQTILDMRTVSTDSDKSVGQTASPLSDVNATSKDIGCQESMSLRSEENLESSGGVWLTVSDIPLLTQTTRAPPPSRPPPPRPSQVSKAESGFPTSTNARKNVNKSSSVPNSTQYLQSRKSVNSAGRSSAVSQIDELADFTMVRTQNDVEECADFLSGEGAEMNSAAAESAAAMKEAMDRVGAKFKHAKEVREGENAKTARSEETMQDAEVREQRERQERFEHELQQREREEEERERRRLKKESENTREIEREKEEKEEQRRRREREREKGRQAVERATREARGRAAAEALKKAKKAAVEKANAEARERAERAAVQRVQAEARERAAAEAKERAEKAAAEARERANAEAREKKAQERAVFARAEAEAQRKAARAAVERAAAEARERAAAAARANQQKNENDHEAFFSMGTRPSSADGPRSNLLHENGQRPEVERTSNGAFSSMKKASSTANIVDDLISIFGVKATPSSGELQEVESENEERHRARLERHQRTQERAAKALAEKNQRDLQAQQEQEERHMIADALDAEIKRWAAGKEGNLCALLSTLQYVLWPECGWKPVSLADLVTGASVKKAYRKATLCIHPDKVQQKGSNLQQKYIAEKVFDLLKDSWNKLNSEEPF